MHTRLFVCAAALVITALPLAAQAQDKPAVFTIGGGYTAPNAEVSDRLGDGYNFTIGAQFNVNPKFGIEGLYSFNGLGEKGRTINIADTPGGPTTPSEVFGSMNMQYGTIAGVFQA